MSFMPSYKAVMKIGIIVLAFINRFAMLVNQGANIVRHHKIADSYSSTGSINNCLIRGNSAWIDCVIRLIALVISLVFRSS